MNVKKKKTTILTCIIAGTCVLATSALANYSTSNGYEVYKKSLKGLIGLKNYTLTAKMSAAIDGEEKCTFDYKEQYDKLGDVLFRQTSSNTTPDSTSTYEVQYQDGISYQIYEEGICIGYPRSDEDYSPSELDVPESDMKTVQKVIRFGELLTDTVVGDLKNNFIYMGETEGGGAEYSIKLDAIQIPELINAGLSALCSMSSSGTEYDSEPEYFDFGYYMYGDAAVKSASCDFTIDGDGRLVSNKLSAEFTTEGADGKQHTITFSLLLGMSDYGTTKIDRLDKEITDNAIVQPDYSKMSEEEYNKALEAYNKALNEAWGNDENAEETTETAVTEDTPPVIVGGANGPTAVYITD